MEPIALIPKNAPRVNWNQPRQNNPFHSPSHISYPATAKKAHSEIMHGVVVADDYKWLEDSKNPDIQEWENLQAKAAERYLKDLSIMPIVHSVFSLIIRDSKTPPEPVLQGNRQFSWESKKHQTHSILYMHENGKTIELVDPNKWNSGLSCHNYFANYNGRYVALTISENQDHRTIIKILDATKKIFLTDHFCESKQDHIDWSPSRDEFLYSASEKAEDPHHTYLHRVGDNEKDQLLFEGTKEAIWTKGRYSADGNYLIFSRARGDQKNELYFKDVRTNKVRSIIKGCHHISHACIVNDRIFILSDVNANMSEIYVTSVKHPHQKNWTTHIKEDPGFKLESIKLIDGHLYILGIRNASHEIKIYDLEGNHQKDIPLPCHGSASVEGHWGSSDVRVTFQSFLYPETFFKYHFMTNTLTLLHQNEVSFEPSNYALDQVFATSQDGTRISMFLLRQKAIKTSGKNPTVIAGYGGFNISATPGFLPVILPWIDAGGIVAIPNIRGGGEYGEKWHDGGKGKNKQNCFDDFFASIEYLINNRWTSSEHIAAWGGSNGGILMGALATQRPELVRAIVCLVPLLDMVGMENQTMGDVWSKEYGSVKDPEMFPILHNYSPYHHVQNGLRYPSMLITTAENDSLVNPGHGRKMTARLQEANPNGNPIIYMKMSGGHAESSSFLSRIQEMLRLLAFIAKELDVKMPEKSFVGKMGTYTGIAGLAFDILVKDNVKKLMSGTPQPK